MIEENPKYFKFHHRIIIERKLKIILHTQTFVECDKSLQFYEIQ